MMIWHKEQDEDLNNQILEERGSVKHKSNSIRDTQGKSINEIA